VCGEGLRVDLDLLPVACLLLRPADGGEICCTALNRRARQLLQMSDSCGAADALRHLACWLGPGQHADFLQHWHQAQTGHRPLTWEGQLDNTRDGLVLLQINLEPGPQHSWCAVLIELHDRQTPRREAETALQITESIPVGTYVMEFNAAGEPRFIFLSERWLQMLDLEREAVFADPSLAIQAVHPEDRATLLDMNAAVFAQTKRFFWKGRMMVRGDIRWISIESIPRTLAGGRTIWEGVMIDITEWVQAQQRIQRQREQLERILNNIPVAIAITDLDDVDPRITFLNATFIQTLGYRRSDIPRQSEWAERAFPDPAYRNEAFHGWNAAMASARAQQGMVQQTEYRVCSSDGRSLEVLINAVVLEDMALIALVDVSASREAERKLQRSLEDKLRVSLSASAVAHEIQQPLSTILLSSKLALTQLPSGHGLERQLSTLVSAAERMHRITERIRLLLRNLHTERQVVDLRDVMDDAVMLFGAALRSPEVVFTCSMPDQPCTISGDAVQLQQALVNLLRNGLEALKQSRRKPGELRLSLQSFPEGLDVRVADSGPGFSAGLDPTSPLNSTKPGGHGIGLYLVHLTVSNHGGSVHFGRSAELGGAEVVLRLPRQSAGS
jgi:signal transduction histidine kinase